MSLSSDDLDGGGNDATIPLCVELEGALIGADLGWETRLRAFKSWLLNPLDSAKSSSNDQSLIEFIDDADAVPLRMEIVQFVRDQEKLGRRVVLLSRLAPCVAERLARPLGFAGAEIVSDVDLELSALRKMIGEGPFDFVGQISVQRGIGASARRVHAVGDSQRRGGSQPYQTFSAGRAMGPLINALRPHQWAKNALILLPLFLAHQIMDWRRVAAGAFAFCAMSLCASAVYIVNDLLDIQADRRHPTKRNRPFASGRASIPAGLALAVACLLGAAAFVPLLPWKFGATLGTYLVLTTLYSFWLKRKVLIDVMLIASLYTLRIIAGAMAVDVPLTMWLLAFSMFFFLSLAFVKRYSELIQIEHAGGDDLKGRGYRVSDLRIIEAIGPASGYLSVLVFCNYLDSGTVRNLYGRPQVLWLVAPLLLYWITRVWLLARRRMMHDDPVVFALRDRTSQICGVLALVVILLAWAGLPHG